jgi:DNA-binding NarL/FixJ family response regulator
VSGASGGGCGGEQAPQERGGQRPRRVFIVDDHPIFREGLRQVINGQPDLRVCGEASTATEAIDGMASAEPDLVVVDLSLARSDGLDLIKDLRVRYPRLPVLVVSNHDESEYAERCLRAGCRGYIMKSRPPGDVVAGVRATLEGKIHVSEEIAHRMLERLSGGTSKSSRERFGGLTDRELQVFGLYGKGLSTREIAGELHLSIKTIQSHREHIKAKMQLANTSDLLRSAVQWVESQSGL